MKEIKDTSVVQEEVFLRHMVDSSWCRVKREMIILINDKYFQVLCYFFMTPLLFIFIVLNYCLFFLLEYLNVSNFLDEDVIHLEDHQDAK